MSAQFIILISGEWWDYYYGSHRITDPNNSTPKKRKMSAVV